ncbi:hypothetical protein Agub_g11268 [Astrephomene gubernaculifera]|uniref:Uracil-DNA glycosylase n=1 Tax=Astrephomene gubernaculifera TaxID=47775 RepID=A0AAD3DZ30_9CHLO|nr:hypothetical protein Agub_g11268 [Astrephomene gubernaculifera]
MSTGAKQPKRAKTIDTFFRPKQNSKVSQDGITLGVLPPRCGVVINATDGPGDTAPASEPQKPVIMPDCTAPSAGEADAAVAGGSSGSPPGSGRKRRRRQPASDQGGGSTTEVEVVAAEGAGVQPSPPELAASELAAGGAPAAVAAVATVTAATAADMLAAAADCAADTKRPTVQPPGAKEGQQQQQQQLEGAEPPSADGDGEGLTPAQRAQIAANHNRALARRAVAESSAPGAPPLSLSSLLVEPGWRAALEGELRGANVRQLEAFLRGEWGAGRKPVFPPQECIFQAFNACPFDQVRVVILGQDPYHGPSQAMGLSFSVPREVRPLPPSLLNIYKEAAEDLQWGGRPAHGDLSSWSVQGVLLLNTCLTVRQGEANSHSKRGWEAFTDGAIRALSQRRSGLVFLLWGNPAQAKASLVDTRKHHVLKAAHPSPLSASRGFFGCRHFSKANQLLQQQGLQPIQWLPE